MTPFVEIAFEVVHFTGATGVDPGIEKVGVRGFPNRNDAAMVKAKTVGFVFDAGGKGG